MDVVVVVVVDVVVGLLVGLGDGGLSSSGGSVVIFIGGRVAGRLV